MIDRDDAEFKAEIERISTNIKKTMRKIQNILPEDAEKSDPEPSEKKPPPQPHEE